MMGQGVRNGLGHGASLVSFTDTFFRVFFLRNSRSAIFVLTSCLLLSSYFEIPRRCTVCNSVFMINQLRGGCLGLKPVAKKFIQ